MSITWPAALLALTALVIPLVIHWLQRGEHREVLIATTQFIKPSLRARWRALHLHEPLLLALRCLLLAAAALLLAEPFTDAASASFWDAASIDATSTLAPAANPPADIALVYDAARLADAQWVNLALTAWRDAGLASRTRLVASADFSALAPWTIWLSEAPVPQRDGIVLTDRPAAPSQAVARPPRDGTQWQLMEWWQGPQRRLNVTAGLTADGPLTGDVQFASQLLTAFASGEQRVPPAGVTGIAAPVTATVHLASTHRSLVPQLAIIVLLLWCLERMVSAAIAARARGV